MPSWYRSRRRRSSALLTGRRNTQTRRYCGLTRREIIHILSSLALPLMLGVFTVVITFDQKNQSNKQRIEDRHLAEEQRNQDLNISRQQRLEDRELAREQRLQDLNQSILQRELERTIADETRNISEQNQIHQFELEDKRYRDDLLINYITEMSHLLEENNGSIDLTRTLIRLKTLTLIRQLDSNRNTQVIRFLYESGQLNAHDQFPFDLSESELFAIDLSSKKPNSKMLNLYLPNVDLTDSSFVNRNLTGANFSSTILINVDFSFTILENIDLSSTIFNGTFNIYNAALRNINFAYANLQGIDFLYSLSKSSECDGTSRLYFMNFSKADLRNTRFCGLDLAIIHFRELSDDINFFNTTLTDIIFESISSTHLNFSYSYFVDNVTFSNLLGINNSSFYKSTMDKVKFIANDRRIALKNDIFDFANLSKMEFVDITLSESSFINAKIKESSFSNCALDNCTFINASMSNVLFDGSMIDTNFDNAILKENFILSNNQTYIFHSSFRRTQMQNMMTDYCEFFSVDMNGANLTDSTMFAGQLTMSNLINTDFTRANLSMIDLSHSNMFNANITDEQLHSAFSIENTTLPNGTIAHDIPLLRNGDPNCYQNIEPPNSIIINNKSINCMFIVNQSLRINISRTMTQTINVTRFKHIFNRPLTKLQVNANCNDYVTIYVIQRNINQQILKKSKVWGSHGNLSPNIETNYVELKLQFDNNTGICDNIRFKIGLII